jgi:hypothetical protein
MKTNTPAGACCMCSDRKRYQTEKLPWLLLQPLVPCRRRAGRCHEPLPALGNLGYVRWYVTSIKCLKSTAKAFLLSQHRKLVLRAAEEPFCLRSRENVSCTGLGYVSQTSHIVSYHFTWPISTSTRAWTETESFLTLCGLRFRALEYNFTLGHNLYVYSSPVRFSYHRSTFSFCQNSPVFPPISPSASITGVVAPSSGVFVPPPLVMSVFTHPGQQTLISTLDPLAFCSRAIIFVNSMVPALLTAHGAPGQPCTWYSSVLCLDRTGSDPWVGSSPV